MPDLSPRYGQEPPRRCFQIPEPMNLLETYEGHIKRAKSDLEAELKKRWPVGTEISFWFNSRAQNCTIGTVSGHDGNGYVHVELAKLNRRGYRTIKRVWWRKIS